MLPARKWVLFPLVKMELRGEPRRCVMCGAPGCSTRFQSKQGFYCGFKCERADQRMQQKSTPSKHAKYVGAGTLTRPNEDDAKLWQDTKTLVDEVKQRLKVDNSQV